MQEHPSTKSKTYKYVYELNKWRQFLLSIRETFKLGA